MKSLEKLNPCLWDHDIHTTSNLIIKPEIKSNIFKNIFCHLQKKITCQYLQKRFSGEKKKKTLHEIQKNITSEISFLST